MITGNLALLMVVAPIAIGLVFLFKFRDWFGYLAAGLCLYVSWSLATTGTLPDHSDSPVTIIVVFGGILLFFARDVFRLTKHARAQSRDRGFVVAEQAAGCAGVVQILFIVLVGLLIYAYAMGVRP